MNVTSMKKRDSEVVDMAARRRLDSVVSGRLYGKVRVQQRWVSTSFSGWAVRREFMG